MGNIDIESLEPLRPTEEEEHTLNALFSYKAALKDSAFYITTPSPTVQRYSDQFKRKRPNHSLKDLKTDLKFFPEELRIIKNDSLASTSVLKENNKRVVGGEEEFEKYEEDQLLQEEDEYGDATDYVESYFDNGEGDDLYDDSGQNETYFD
ncbi:11984_t:CDS:2 [Entrophospora sp. SA101]|nr:11984_t:CDS:2 [Entrophospora sp. SA101]CAJ0840853.1 15043_t:CDS:2 [Entrophospora sp. SA101]